MKENEIIVAEESGQELIQVVQIPVIVEQLHTIKSQIEAASERALSMEVSEDTLKSVKKTRADMRRAYQDLERKRKQVQEIVMAPYNDFLKVYNECVTDIFSPCDARLKQKIDAVEDGLKAQKRDAVEAYFNEYAQSLSIDFVRFDDARIVVTRTASLKSLKKNAKDFLDCVNQGIQFIASSSGEDADEVLYEFKRNGYDAMSAITTIKERKAAMEEERRRRLAMEEERQRRAEEEARKRRILEEERERQEQEQEEMQPSAPTDTENEFLSQQTAIEQVLNDAEELSTPEETPVEESTEPVEQEPQTEAEYELTFTVRGKLSALKELKQFLVNGPYEIIE